MNRFFLYGIVYLLLNYIALSILLVKLAEAKYLKNSWLSWLPIGNLWILGKIIKSFAIGKKRFQGAEYRLLASSLVFLLVFKIPVIGIVVGLAYMVLVTSCFVELAKQLNTLKKEETNEII